MRANVMGIPLLLWAIGPAFAAFAMGEAMAQSLPATELIQGASGRNNETYLSIAYLVSLAVGGLAFLGAVYQLVNKLLSDARADSREKLESFRAEMASERSYHAAEIAKLIESDERQQAESRASMERVVAKFDATVRDCLVGKS